MDLFKNEGYSESYKGHQEIVQDYQRKGIIKVNQADGTAQIQNLKRSMTLISFFAKLVQPLYDTYLITLSTFEQLCGKKNVIRQKTIVKEIHEGIKNLYAENCIPTLHSCVKETIKSAI